VFVFVYVCVFACAREEGILDHAVKHVLKVSKKTKNDTFITLYMLEASVTLSLL
jgi:hypothetical protein